MILALSLALLAQPPLPPQPAPETEEGKAAQCLRNIASAPEATLAQANRWRAAGGGLHARQCIGLAYVQLEQWTAAASNFEQAAQEAQRGNDARATDFWVQSGNAWLAGGELDRAIAAFDAALATQNLTPELRGEVRLDRARVLVAQNKLVQARQDMDQALALVPADPMAWYLSAALAQRQGDLARARTDIAKARQLARDNPDVLLLAGTIAGQSGDMAEAERIYRQVAQSAPNTDAGKAAQRSLSTIGGAQAAAPSTAPAPTPPPATPR